MLQQRSSDGIDDCKRDRFGSVSRIARAAAAVTSISYRSSVIGTTAFSIAVRLIGGSPGWSPSPRNPWRGNSVPLIMRRFFFLLMLVFMLTACGDRVGSATPAVSGPPDGGLIIDCEAVPLANPLFDIEGAEVPKSGHLRLTGAVDGVVQAGGQVQIAIWDEQSGPVTVRLGFARPMQIDLRTGTVVLIDYWQRQGFEGISRGIRISDDLGVVLIADDGDYGNAVLEDDLAPFTIAQTDAGCRNRENRPDDLNNFKLVVSAGEGSVELIHGATGELVTSSGEYVALALRSVARVGDVLWTDAPYEFTSFVIARVPIE